jgi:hypothetical protein
MPKGFFTATACLLTDGRATYADVKGALVGADIEVAKETPGSESWAISGPSLVVPFRREHYGCAAVDLVQHPWPDAMGDPKSDAMTFAAWSMGHFGPFAYPGGLQRAGQHSWSWEAGRTVADGHKAFIRVRIGYAFGAPEDARVIPEDYDPLEELEFLNRIILALFELPGVLCYFNPNGEVLRDERSFRQACEFGREHDLMPLNAWSNVRFFNLSEEFGFMDTVGNGQLDIRDIEAIFPMARYEPGNIDNYLRNVTLYLHGLDREMKSGETIDGPGETGLSWCLELVEDGLVAPPRSVLRLFPTTDAREVRKLLAAVQESAN